MVEVEYLPGSFTTNYARMLCEVIAHELNGLFPALIPGLL